MKKISYIISLTFIILLLTDFLFGEYLLKFTPKKIDPTINHQVYDHDLKRNFRANLEWSPDKKYSFCTDANSFRTFCENINSNQKNFDIAFIGDSFTEGVGLEYSNTFVGKISRNFSDLKIANLGVVSYSPSIYFTKLNYLINNGYKFKRIIIYFDISDVYDDNKKYYFKDGKIFRKKSVVLSAIQKSLKSLFPFLAYSTKAIKNNFLTKFLNRQAITTKCTYLDYCHEKSSWTFNDDYFKKKEINKSFEFLEMTYKLLQNNDIKMSIGIYPWPSQIMYDNENSKIVSLMTEFCLKRCEFFFNNFIEFFNEIKLTSRESVVSKYYINNDVHFNTLGNEKISTNFINTFKN
ncbi:hypothetical protein OA178_00840 [Candidatus Pelagibacter sp.]|nr:hypothetical protein [Candidatus Pelagibacter sp.]